MSKIKIIFMRNKNYLAMTILEMDERFRYSGYGNFPEFISKNGFIIKSRSMMSFDGNCIFLRGNNRKEDNFITSSCFRTEQEAFQYIENVKEALKDWSENWEGFKKDKQEEIIVNNIEIFEV